MVGDDDCSQLQGPGIKGALHDGAVAWVNDDRLVSAPQGPDVIVDERRQRLNGDHVAGSAVGWEVKYLPEGDRKSVGKGTSVTVRVDLGGRRVIKNQRERNH